MCNDWTQLNCVFIHTHAANWPMVVHYDYDKTLCIMTNQTKKVAATDKNHKNCQNRVMGDCVITNNLTSFSILRIADVRHIRLSNVKNLTLCQMLGSKKVKSSCPCNLSTDLVKFGMVTHDSGSHRVENHDIAATV